MNWQNDNKTNSSPRRTVIPTKVGPTLVGPQWAGATKVAPTVLIVFVSFFLLFLIGCKSTYSRDTMREDIKTLAKKEYKLDVEVQDVGNTVGVQLRVKNILGELLAEDQRIWKQMENLMMVLSRVTMSADHAPDYVVLDILDEENPNIHFLFTRYTQDVKKLMGEVISRNQFFDRLLMEFDINGERIPYDPYEMDLIQIMMRTMDGMTQEAPDYTDFELEAVNPTDFLSKVVANTVRRVLRDKKRKKDAIVRSVETDFDAVSFRILLDMVGPLDQKLMPLLAQEASKIFQSYKFKDFSDIVVIEKNSGKMFLLPKK